MVLVDNLKTQWYFLAARKLIASGITAVLYKTFTSVTLSC